MLPACLIVTFAVLSAALSPGLSAVLSPASAGGAAAWAVVCRHDDSLLRSTPDTARYSAPSSCSPDDAMTMPWMTASGSILQPLLIASSTLATSGWSCSLG